MARGIVEACGEHSALDAWRQLSERGHSLRPTHMNAFMKKVFWPRDAVQAKDLEMVAKKRVSMTHRKVVLDEVCPERSRAHLRVLGPEKLPTYEAMRAEIWDWLVEELRKAPKQRAAALGQAAGAEEPGANAEWDSETLDFLDMALEDLDRNRVMALVENIEGECYHADAMQEQVRGAARCDF